MQSRIFNLRNEMARRGLHEGGPCKFDGLSFDAPVLIHGYEDDGLSTSVELDGWVAPKITIFKSVFGALSIVNCKFDELIIQEVRSGDTVSINSSKIDRYILRKIEAGTLQMSGSGFFDIGSTKVDRTRISLIDSASIRLRGGFEGRLVLIEKSTDSDNCSFDVTLEALSNIDLMIGVRLKGLNLVGAFSDVHLRQIKQPIASLNFSLFSSSNRLSLNWLLLDRDDGVLSLSESDLSNVQFYECDLNAKNFFVRNCLLNDCQSYATDWPFEPNLTRPAGALAATDVAQEVYSSGEIIRQRISYFRQLKNVYEKGGDVLRSSQYRMHELSELERVCDSWIDKVPLWVGNVSSKHGTNWVLPLCWMLALGFVFTICSILAIPGSCQPASCNIAYNLITSINPTHKILEYSYLADFSDVHKIPWWFLWVDLILRAVNSYLIFQVVRSFRRFIK